MEKEYFLLLYVTKVGLPAVTGEPAALLTDSRTRLIGRRRVIDGITVALAREASRF